jgi:hypothetical protein
LQADAGSFVSLTGSASQSLCPVGTYQPNAGAAACISAAAGSFVATVGATAQTPCADGFTSNAGASVCFVAEKAALQTAIAEAEVTLTTLKSQFAADPSAAGKEAVLNSYIGLLNQADDATANAAKAAANAALVSAQLAALQPSGTSKEELKTFKNQQKALKAQIKTILKTQKAAVKSSSKLVKSAAKLAKKQKLSLGAVQLAEQIQNQSALIDDKKEELAALD